MSKSFRSGAQGIFSLVLMSSLSLAGCNQAGEVSAEDVATKGQQVLCQYCTSNGPYLQNGHIDGTLVKTLVKNASDENWNILTGMGTTTDPVSLSNISFNGNSVFKVRGDRGFFSVTYLDPPFTVKTKTGLNTTGLKFKFSIVNGSGVRTTYQMKVSGVNAPPPSNTFPNGSPNYAFFNMQWTVDGANNWHSVCGTDTQPYPAILVAGSKWNIQDGSRADDGNAITIGCPDDAVGACIDWGYEPWVDRDAGQYQFYPAFASNGIVTRPGKDIHQTCTREKRADFPGLGYSYTESGRTILVGDSLNTPANPLSPSFPNDYIEAVWGPNGATCLNRDNMRTPSNFPNPDAYNAYLSIPRCMMPPGPIDGIQITGYDGN